MAPPASWGVFDGINNREIASLCWLAVALGWMLTWPAGRQAVRGVAQAVAHPYVIGPIILLGAWVWGLTRLASRVDVWDQSVAGATVVWALTVGVGMLVNVSGVTDRSHWFRHELKKALALTAFAEAFLNVAVLSLPIEFVLVPVLTFMVLMSTYAEGREDLAAAKVVIDSVLGLAAVGMLLFVLIHLVANVDDLGGGARGFALPLWLTTGTLPFIYVVGLCSAYQTAFAFLAEAEPRARWPARGAMLGLGLNANTVSSFRAYSASEVAAADSWRAATKAVRDFRQGSREEREAFRAAERSLRARAGQPGTDAEGRRLDQREFAETKSALQRIAVAHVGWFSRAPRGRYRADLLPVLEPLRGLPQDHGVQMRVAEGGQAWYAWRRTVTGWCFAIGAAEGPPDEWLYDGPDPPQGFPGQDPTWVSGGAWTPPTG